MSIQTGKPLSNYKLNILCSFAYAKKNLGNIYECCHNFNFLMDSGGYTNYWLNMKGLAKGKVVTPAVTLDEYCEFGRNVAGKIYGYIALDKPRDEQGTAENLDYMVKKGLQPIPVFTENYSYSNLPKLLDVNDRICVAGAVYSPDEYIIQRYQKVWKESKQVAKIHALGLGRFSIIYNVPIKSADSSTWINGSKYGTCSFFDLTDKMIHIPPPMSKRGKNITSTPRWAKILGLFHDYNVTLEEIYNVDSWRVKSKTPSLTLATMAFAFIRFVYHLNIVSDIHYFLVLPHLDKGQHIVNLLAVLESFSNFNHFDYQLYKSKYKEIDEIDPGNWSRQVNIILEKFYAKVNAEFNSNKNNLFRYS